MRFSSTVFAACVPLGKAAPDRVASVWAESRSWTDPQRVHLGVNLWSMHTKWPALMEAAVRADRLGYDTLSTSDHVYAVVGSRGPVFEGYLSLAAWAQATVQIQLGLLATANTFREPTLVAKMATTLDHISGGRAFLGIGAGWFEDEHEGFGFEYGSGPGERLRWLGEALPVIRAMLRGDAPTASGPRYRVSAARNDPRPMQQALPILIAGGGERVTLRLVAQYGDACNLGFHQGVDALRHKDQVLRRHCLEVGRDESEIARTTEIRLVIIRDTRREAERAYLEMRKLNGNAPMWPEQPVGTPDDVVEKLQPVVALGFRHLICGFPYPHDEESMVRLIAEVLPRLDEAGAA